MKTAGALTAILAQACHVVPHQPLKPGSRVEGVVRLELR